jgi:hypothetical protein
MPENQKFYLTIKPAIRPKDRHQIEDALKKMDYDVTGGGQLSNGTVSDITFLDGKKKGGTQTGGSK